MRVLAHLTDAELLGELESARFHSPVIGELCRRLDAKRATVDHYELDCPVCRAPLHAISDQEAEELKLEVR